MSILWRSLFQHPANIKESEHSFFIQLADIVSYAALMKVKGEMGRLTPWQEATSLASLYDTIPVTVLNTRASYRDPLGIVRL